MPATIRGRGGPLIVVVVGNGHDSLDCLHNILEVGVVSTAVWRLSNIS